MHAFASAQRSTSAVRVIFGFIWLVDAYYKWQPAFRNGFVGLIHDAAKGQPSWLGPWFKLWQSVFALQPTLFAYGIAIAETLLALALLTGFARKLTYSLGAAWSIMIWTTAEGFGKPSGVQTDIGTAIIYAVVFLALLALDARFGTRALSVDALLEKRIPWWSKLAEVRR
jgi:nitrite reductase (NO-forming)